MSDALKLPSGRSAVEVELRQAMAAIDSVHGDGNLPPIPVDLAVSKPKHLGEYAHIWDKAVGIGINPKNSKDQHWGFTFAHEVGHFLDHKGWGGSGFSSATEAAAKAWLDAVRASPEVQRLAELHRERPRIDYYKYALKKNELWARSYAQWIAVRSGDKKMLETLTKIKTDAAREGYRMSQWGAAEFEPIAKAIDDLFAMLGWRHP